MADDDAADAALAFFLEGAPSLPDDTVDDDAEQPIEQPDSAPVASALPAKRSRPAPRARDSTATAPTRSAPRTKSSNPPQRRRESAAPLDLADWHCSACFCLEPPASTRVSAAEAAAAGGTDATTAAEQAAALCDTLLSCEAGCLRSFHPACLGWTASDLAAVTAAGDASWSCAACAGTIQHACFLCNALDPPRYMPTAIAGVPSSSSAPELTLVERGVVRAPGAAVTADASASVATAAATSSTTRVLFPPTPLELCTAALTSAKAFSASVDSAFTLLKDWQRGPAANLVDAAKAACSKTGSAAAPARTDAGGGSDEAVDPPRGEAPAPAPSSTVQTDVGEADVPTDDEATVHARAKQAAASPRSATQMQKSSVNEGRGGVGTFVDDPDELWGCDEAADVGGGEVAVSGEVETVGKGHAGARRGQGGGAVARARASGRRAVSYVPPLVGGAPSALVGTPFPSTMKCALPHCGRFFHYACLRQLSDTACDDGAAMAAMCAGVPAPLIVPADFLSGDASLARAAAITPHASPLAGTAEPLWLAPGALPHFICPQHFCSTCETDVAGSRVTLAAFGVSAAAAAEHARRAAAARTPTAAGNFLDIDVAPRGDVHAIRIQAAPVACSPVYVPKFCMNRGATTSSAGDTLDMLPSTDAVEAAWLRADWFTSPIAQMPWRLAGVAGMAAAAEASALVAIHLRSAQVVETAAQRRLSSSARSGSSAAASGAVRSYTTEDCAAAWDAISGETGGALRALAEAKEREAKASSGAGQDATAANDAGGVESGGDGNDSGDDQGDASESDDAGGDGEGEAASTVAGSSGRPRRRRRGLRFSTRVKKRARVNPPTPVDDARDPPVALAPPHSVSLFVSSDGPGVIVDSANAAGGGGGTGVVVGSGGGAKFQRPIQVLVTTTSTGARTLAEAVALSQVRATPREREWLFVAADRAALVRKLLAPPTRRPPPTACLLCPRFFHALGAARDKNQGNSCAPPGSVANEFAFLCPSHADASLPGDERTRPIAASAAAAPAALRLRGLFCPPPPPPGAPADDWRHFRLPANALADARADAEAREKPLPFSLIKKNVYTIPVRAEWPDDGECVCELACGDDCLNRTLRFECFGGGGASSDSGRSNCAVGAGCGNRAMGTRAGAGLSVVRTPGKGWGLVATEPLKAGSFIIEYVSHLAHNS